MEEKMEKTECRKPIKVFSKDRQVKKGIVASTYEEFSNCCKEKFLLDSARLNFVLEEDGTEVDSCYWETLAPNTKVMLLQDDDVWEPAAGTSGSSTDTSTTSSRVIQLMEKFKQKKAAKPSLVCRGLTGSCIQFIWLKDNPYELLLPL
ncbi:lipid transferase CIDEC-like [Argopecten irradians]|uniref:lipid transferase CIDEC-like n=1 Tax=Argopecten irradians TaxID=31199 RepID=UPI003716927E